jgi:8-oxo-dGTP pyrophosphatase MutT (NUDIX family)
MSKPLINFSAFDLNESLNRYEAFDGAEQANLLLTRHLVANVERCFWRDQFEPGHVCGSSWIVTPDIAKVALIRHPIFDAWMMAGGHSDGDADTMGVALRETEEEMGINPTCLMTWNETPIFDVDIHSIPANPKKGEPEHVHLDLRFLFMHPEVPLVSPEKIEMRWFTMDEAKAMFTKGGGRYRCIEKLTSLSFHLRNIG